VPSSRERGTNILFEMLPAQFFARAFARSRARNHPRAGAGNGGIMLDNVHFVRSGIGSDEIARKLGPVT